MPQQPRAGEGGTGGRRAAAVASPGPYGLAARGTTAASAASGLGHARPAPVLQAHMLLPGRRERVPEASRRYLRAGARTRVTADPTSSLSCRHVRPAHCPLIFNRSWVLPNLPSPPVNGLTHIREKARKGRGSRDAEGGV